MECETQGRGNRLVSGVESDADGSFVDVPIHTEVARILSVDGANRDQVTNVNRRSFVKASASCRAQGHSLWRCKVARRPVVVTRPAVCRSA